MFRIFGQYNSLFVVIEALITCNLGIAMENADLYNPFFLVNVFFLQFIYDYCPLNMRYGMCNIGMHSSNILLYVKSVLSS